MVGKKSGVTNSRVCYKQVNRRKIFNGKIHHFFYLTGIRHIRFESDGMTALGIYLLA